MKAASQPIVLVTGATGYIGGRLVPHLLTAGYRVRCMTRSPAKLGLHPWRDDVEIVRADALEPSTLKSAMAGCEFAYYLIHSMDGSGDFRSRDAVAAKNFREAADRAGLRRIVYLGGLGDEKDALSHHLDSRQEVGRVLAAGKTPVTEMRAAVIIGSGSVSFEMLRYLTEVLPVMTTPKWVRTRCQPIAIGDVLEILAEALGDPGGTDRIFEIGGPDILSYEEMMQIYAQEAGLPRRRIIPVPVLSPRLSSLWIGLVTPLPVGVARPLVDSLRNEVVVRDDSIAEVIPYEPTPYRTAVRLALQHTRELEVTTRWSDASELPAAPQPSDPSWSGGTVFIDRREVPARATPDDLFWAFSRLGGSVGYYAMNWAWRLRGWLDSASGGVGLRRGRRHPTDLRPGEALDFWRVAAVEPGRRLVLRAEMKLPGTAWLSFVAVEDTGGTHLHQEARFEPRGLLGRLYWYALFPFHIAIFGRMARRIARSAEARTEAQGRPLAAS